MSLSQAELSRYPRSLLLSSKERYLFLLEATARQFFHPDRQTKRSRGRVARINSPSFFPSFLPSFLAILPLSSLSASNVLPFSFGRFVDELRIRHIFLSPQECFPRARSFQTSIRKREKVGEGYILFRRENKMACLVALDRKGGNLRSFFVHPFLNGNPTVLENDGIASGPRCARRFR